MNKVVEPNILKLGEIQKTEDNKIMLTVYSFLMCWV